MENIICFGAGHYGSRLVNYASEDKHILAFADNDQTKIGHTFCGHKVIAPEDIEKLNYDKIVITIDDRTANGPQTITAVYNQLIKFNINSNKIFLQNTYYLENDPRVMFLRALSNEPNFQTSEASVAECGVFRGDFAAHINNYFPTKSLYLLDTFEGFVEADRLASVDEVSLRWLNSELGKFYYQGSEFLTRLRCPNRDLIKILKGGIAETLDSINTDKFSFVNLDMDLYPPQLIGLRFFAPRMISGGVILVHDYYVYPAVKQAVEDFSLECKFKRLPIGDYNSMALIF